MSEEENTAPEETPSPAEPAAPTSSGGFDIGTVIEQAKQVVTDPRGFYSAMAKSGGISEPLIFTLVMGAVAGAVFGVLSLIGLTGQGAAGLAAIIFMPIGILIGGFIGAAILFVIWKLMGSVEDYETAYRCVAYSTAIFPIVAVISIIPYLGTLVRIGWGIWLLIIASEEVHGRPRQISMVVFGLLGGIGLIMGLSGEYTQRNIQPKLEKKAEQLQEQFKGLEKLGTNEDGEIDPEQAGRALGSFLRGIQEEAEKASKKTVEEASEPEQ